MTGSLGHDCSWSDVFAVEERCDDRPLLGPNSFEPDPAVTTVVVQRSERSSNELKDCSEVDLEFALFHGVVEEALCGIEPAPHIAMSASELAKPTGYAQGRRRKRPSFLGRLFFFTSSALAGLAANLIIFKLAGVDPFGLDGVFSGQSALPPILATLVLSSIILATYTYLRYLRRLQHGHMAPSGKRRWLFRRVTRRRAAPEHCLEQA